MRPVSRILLLVLATTVLITADLMTSTVHATPPPCADLVITNFTVEPTDTLRIVAGRNAKVSVTVKNQIDPEQADPPEGCQSLSFTMQWTQDDEGLFTPPAGPAEHTVGGLAPDASTTIEFEFAYPQAGDFTSVATLDTGNTVDETNESNNIEIAPVKVWANLPDLTVTNFSVVPAMPAKGEPAAIQITVLNEGTADAGPFVVQWTQDDSLFVPTGPSQQVSALAAGETTTLEYIYAFQEARDYNTVVRLDTSNTVVEWNETNNMAIIPVTVVETAPDLVIWGISITPVRPATGCPAEGESPLFPQDQPVAGLNALIEITVKNQGADPAGAFVVQWKSGLLAPTGPSEQINGLDPGETKVVTFEYAFPNAGNFTTVATVDTDFDVAEANESNNLQVEPVTVQFPVVDLVLKEFTLEPAPGVLASIPPNPVRNRLTQVTIVVENCGNSPAGSFLVKWEPGIFVAPLSWQVNELDYDESINIVFDYTYPVAGTFLTTAKVDDPNQIFETDESNNNETKQVVVEEELPDLVILDIEFVPSQPVQGTPAKAKVTVFNRGNTPAGPFQVQFIPGFLAPPLAHQVNGLGVDNVDMTVRTEVLEFDFTYTLPGDFTASATADINGVVPELNEFNNSLNKDVTVLVATQDLVINKIEIAEDECAQQALSKDGVQALLRAPEVAAADLEEPILDQNRPYQICVTIQNLGNSAIGPFVVSADPDAFDLIDPEIASLRIDHIKGQRHFLTSFNTVNLLGQRV